MSPRQPQVQKDPAESAARRPTLRSRLLLIVKAAWLVVAVLTTVLFVASVPAYYTQIVCKGAECANWQLQPNEIKALHDLRLSAGLYQTYLVTLEVVYALGFFIIGAFVFWKKSNDKMALLISMALVLFGGTNLVDMLVDTSPAWQLPVAIVTYLEMVLFFISFCLFPDGHFVPRWIRVPAAAWIVYQVPFNFVSKAQLVEGVWGLLNVSLFLGLLGILVAGQIYRYVRVSGAAERQQTKWVVFGLTAAIGALIATVIIGKTFQILSQPGFSGLLYVLASLTIINLSSLLIPLSIGIAILRYHLWDIDVIINRTLVYGSLSAVLAAVFAITDALLLPLVVKTVFGEENPSLNVGVSAVIIAVLFEPLRRRIKERVNRLTDWLAGSAET